MEAVHKPTQLLIERLKTSEIDNLEEASKDYPTAFNKVFDELKEKRYWTDLTLDTAISMCQLFTMNGKVISLLAIQTFFKS